MTNNTEPYIQLERIEKLEKGRYKLYFEQGNEIWVYGYEIRGMKLEEGIYLSEKQYFHLLHEVVGKRVKKRALHLLEKMDRTEQQLWEKLQLSDYPEQCIEDAIAYVKSFHYLDDQRYADTFTRNTKERLSRRQIKQKLMMKGISTDQAEAAIESEYDADESVHIRKLLEKKHYHESSADEGERRRVYQYLLRRGFQSSDILREMKCAEFE